MIRFVTRSWLFGVMVCAASSPAFAQLPVRPSLQPLGRVAIEAPGELHGLIQDDKGKPLAGAVVSAVGPLTTFAVSDRDGRFAFRGLPTGPYLVRAHLQGYVPARGRILQVTASERPIHTIALTRNPDPGEPTVLAAGLGAAPVAEGQGEDDEHEHGELAWRLRHLKRSVLKESQPLAGRAASDDSLLEDSFEGLGRAVSGPARLATALFADRSLNGHVNLLTTTSFDRPQDLFAMQALAPKGIAYVSLVAPGADGDWLVHGTITQGDLSSWIVAGSYRRSADAVHAYEAGMSYSKQQYLGGNSEALLAMRNDSRNVGAVFAYDNWAIVPSLRVGYGARWARYDYLPDENLLSPRVSLTVEASPRLRLRAAVSHRETAPGAAEFTPSAVGLWLPPERTFSQLSRGAFRPERLDHVEIAAERDFGSGVVLGLRAFRQRVNDQLVTLFGAVRSDAARNIGHYHVGSAGDFDAQGWTVSASRTVGDSVRASLDYTHFISQWYRSSPDQPALAEMAPSVLRKDERIHDVTASVETLIAASSTRLFFLYKLNTGFAEARDTTPSAVRDARFNVQINQALPLAFMEAKWEMLVAVTNLFSEDPLDNSVYDELFVIEPPKRVLGGVTIRF
jgi:outer membrane receptor protein involved in Fe transport